MTKFRDTVTDEWFNSEDLPIKVCMSGAGYYIGQLEPCGAPFSRLSYCYYKTREEAEMALKQQFPLRDAPENEDVIKGLKEKGAIISLKTRS